MGIVLGILGIGGAILTTPILIYFFGFNPVDATHYSLLIIGICCVIGAWRYHLLYTLDVRTILIFTPFSTLSAYLTRHFLIPNLPQKIITIQNYTLSSHQLILLTFALTLFLSSFLLLKPFSKPESFKSKHHNPLQLIPISLFTGFLCGFIGVGGGFIMIPVFTSLLQLPMQLAIGTSMAISTIQVSAAFIGGIQAGQTPHPELIITFSLLAISGLFLGITISPKTHSRKLKQLFSVFTLALAIFILFKEFFLAWF